MEDDYYITQGGLIPVKWTAPEVCMYTVTYVIIDYHAYSYAHVYAYDRLGFNHC